MFLLAALLVAAAVLLPPGRTPVPAAPEADDPGHCTVIMVGREASTDGSVMSTHAADCGVCDFTWRHVPAADHKSGEKRRLYNINQIKTWPPSEGGKWAAVLKDPTAVEIPQPARTYGYHHSIFGYVDFHTQVAYNAAIADVQAAQAKWEDGAVARVPEIDQKAAELFKSSPAAAARFLTGYCLDNARSVIEAWWKLGDDLWVKYNHVMLYGVEKRQNGRIPTANPGWWDRAVRAFDAWTDKDGQR